jgi:chloride channel protein, CIC family
VPEPLCAATPLAQAADALAASRHGALPVVAADGAYVGVATARSVAEVLAEGGRGAEAVREIVHVPKPVHADAELALALDALLAADPSGLPVLDADGGRLSGWITHQGVLAAVHHSPA